MYANNRRLIHCWLLLKIFFSEHYVESRKDSRELFRGSIFTESQSSRQHVFESFPGLSASEMNASLISSCMNSNISDKLASLRLTGSELLDMTYEELTGIADLSDLDIAGFVQCAMTVNDMAIVSNPENSLNNLISHPLNLIDSPGVESTTITESGSRPVLNAASDGENSSKKERILALNGSYRIPAADRLYESHKWFLSVASFIKYKGELYNGQRRALMEQMFLIKSCAPYRGLIEPIFVFNPRNSSIYEALAQKKDALLSKLSPSDADEMVEVWGVNMSTSFGIFASPSGALLDMKTLAHFSGVEVLPYEDFRKQSNATLDELLIVSQLMLGEQAELECSRHVLNVNAELFGQQWRIHHFHCLQGWSGSVIPRFAEYVAEHEAKTIGVSYHKGLLHVDSEGDMLYQYDNIMFQYFRIRAFLRFSEDVVTMALTFLKEAFQGIPFLGIHWRRGDRLVFLSDELSPDRTFVVDRVLQSCYEQDLRNVYFMTNCGTQEDIDFIVSQLEGHGLVVKRSMDFMEWENEDKRIALESSIMSFADYVVISSSAVSSTILEERILLGYSSRSWTNLVPVGDYAMNYVRTIASIEREIESDPIFRALVDEQEGLGSRVLECVQDQLIAECVKLVMRSSRSVASGLY